MPSFPTSIPALFREFLGRRPWAFALIMLSPLFVAFESTVMPYALREMIDLVQGLSPQEVHIWSQLANPIFLYIGAWGAMIGIFRFQEWVGCDAMPRLQAELRSEAFAYVQGHSHRFFTDHFAGSLANKISDLPRAMSSLLMLINWRVTPAISVTLSVIVTIAWIHQGAALLLVAWTALHLGIALRFARSINDLSKDNAERKSTLQGMMVDSFTNQLAVRLFARQMKEQDVLGVAQEGERVSHRRMLLAMCRMRLYTDLPMLLATGAMVIWVVMLWQQGAISMGDVVFILYASMNVMTWVWMVSIELPQLYADSGVIHQALSHMVVPYTMPDAADAEPLQLKGGSISFEGVSFGYHQPHGVFNTLTVQIKAGEKVGLVGFSGSGKTTFVNLLLRLYEPQEGRILIDGQDIRAVTQDSLHEAIAVIPQETSLFHRSLRDNICYGRLNASEAEMIHASQQAECHAFIMGLEQGYDTEVGERGVKLSGGQRQRIALARAFLKDAPILVMDEATSALDSVTERVIQQGMQTLMQGRTALVIAHRLSTLAHLDRILVFDKGRLVEDGSHAELLCNQGHYAQLWNMQAGGFLPETQQSATDAAPSHLSS